MEWKPQREERPADVSPDVNILESETLRKYIQSLENALFESEERFKCLIQGVRDSIFIKNTALRYTYVNPAMENLFNMKASNLIGMTDLELFGREAADHIVESDTRVLHGELIEEVHTKPVHGEMRTFSVIKIPLHSRDGQVIGLLGIAHDTTHQKQMTETLHRTTVEKEVILHSIPELVAFYNKDMQIMWANKAVIDALGKTSEEIIGKYCYDVWMGRSTPCPSCSFRQALDNNKSIEKENTFESGQTFFQRIYPVKDSGGTVVGGVVISLDISSRYHSEQALKNSEEKYRKLFEENQDGIFISSPEGKFLDVNPALIKILGYDSKEELLELDIGHDLYCEPKEREYYKALIREKGYVKVFELKAKRKDGQIIVIQVTANAIYDQSNDVIGYRGVVRDITDRKQLEQQLLQVQKMESIGLLAGGIAHDFNNILSGILGYSSFLKMKITKDSYEYPYIELIEKGALGAAELTSQLLAFAQQGTYTIREVNLNTIVNDIMRIITRVFDKSIEIENHLKRSLPNITADIGQIQQVVMNLCVNARDAMPQGGRMIIRTDVVNIAEDTVREQFDIQSGTYVMLSVEDTGTGIDNETIRRIFDPFFTTKDAGKGTGLGLAVVYGVVKKHGGFVEVKSSPCSGSIFSIYFPVTEAEVSHEKPDMNIEPPSGSELILVCDDERSIQYLLKNVLENYGYRVILASNGTEALTIFQKHKNDIKVILLDLVMPGMSGKEACARIRALDENIPILVTSGYSCNETISELLSGKHMDFIEKPFQAKELLSRIRTMLDSVSK